MPLPESAVYPAEIYLLELTDPLQGGLSGVDNLPHIQLANRTAWLKQQIELLAAALAALGTTTASLDSPALTGTPTAPTPPLGALSTRIATLGYVKTAMGNSAGYVDITGPLTLTGATHGGKLLRTAGSIYSLTLPPADSVPAGTHIWLFNAAFGLTLNRQGGDFIDDTTNLTAISLARGDSALLVSNGDSLWTLAGGSLQLNRAGICAGTFTGAGYKRSPGGHIEQWLYIATGTTGAGSIMAPLPIPYPTAILSPIACSANGAAAPSVVGIGPSSSTTHVDVRFGAGTTGVFVRAIGH